MKIASTDGMNKAFEEKGDGYREWATGQTREKKVGQVVMVPLIISYEGRSTRTPPGAGKTSSVTLKLIG